MSNPFQHGPPGFSQDGTFGNFLPRIRSSYGSGLTSNNVGASSNPHAPFNRLSHLLNPPSDNASDLYSTHRPSQTNSMNDERNGASDGSASSSAPQAPRLALFSRAFEAFMNDGRVGNLWAPQQRNNGFFIPSYLEGSAYIQRLEEAHRAQQAQKEGQQQNGGSLQAGQAPGLLRNKSSASHLGMKFDVIERAPPHEDDVTVAPLPSKWNKDDKFGGLEVLGDGLEVKYTAPRGTREHDYEVCSIRADNPIPPQVGLYYFEVTIVSEVHPLQRRQSEATVCVGLSSKNVALSRPPGWEAESYGYHGDDGETYNQQNTGKRYGPRFGMGDTIGCGVNFRTKTVFFTKGGQNLKTAFRDVKGKLYPTVGVKKAGEHIRVNFGQTPFIFDIDKIMKATRAFAEEIHAEKQALNIDSSVPVEGININDDEDAHRRQRIRRAILEGDIDRALKYTHMYYPQVLKDNDQVYFKLKCRKFIEMVRKSAELSHGNAKKSNGHTFDDIPNEMDVDENSYSDQMETEDALDSSTDQDNLLAETVRYGQQLQAEFKDDPRREVGKALSEVFALVAYENPLQVKEIAHLLDRKGRVAVAEELNSAILSSLGKSSRSALENVYGQTSVLLDYLREGGGPGSFITIQSVVDDIPGKAQMF
ncbi:hypothetical protein DL769_002958 [Monosporascus sp. CRB-8-3]|nr:hypothetical protein DL769_002958 [Monosporascus sp. CRB-8-3]